MACVSGLFDSFDEAYDAMTALQEAGTDAAQVSLITNNMVLQAKREASIPTAPILDGCPDQAAAALSPPGESRAFDALGILTLPGIGDVAAIGWVTASLVGVAGSTYNGSQPESLVNTLQQNDVSERMADTYSEALRRGSTLLLIRCAEPEVAKVEALLNEWGSVKIDQRRDIYVAEGWIAFDRTMPPLTLEEIERDRRTRGLGR
ncbi:MULTISPECIES: hypothetical protein [Ochrobactrum]|uniref:Uncharacterized protein n=1 Tax=Ochrobactrum quorumnocens TaxID=271865 RepID=A0A5N1JNI3_9HYPH|nr:MULTISPECIES: hypothetical protein [Brucella/Ochrobactrum group]KAA9356169.1 hypothetical protein F3W84_21970 [[Ochrobactrum] quorumnocens]MBD7993270.1 hypothetical protein [Ochrobactrum gallinarum]MDH7793687.1 hypothetical protein [Ochrobactrum sp. AN78]